MTVDLTPIRDILQLDGGDVELVAESAGTVELQLVLEGAECAECVLPRSILDPIALQLLENSTRGVRAVVIRDPREGGGVV